ncbi:uncharacterized protein [Chiloscyllium punctatum]|uniref:uncharacterized protein n=1 Tax=Chiloscyllium punctatum TaxID=137246 RepID=UPI003B6387B2
MQQLAPPTDTRPRPIDFGHAPVPRSMVLAVVPPRGGDGQPAGPINERRRNGHADGVTSRMRRRLWEGAGFSGEGGGAGSPRGVVKATRPSRPGAGRDAVSCEAGVSLWHLGYTNCYGTAVGSSSPSGSFTLLCRIVSACHADALIEISLLKLTARLFVCFRAVSCCFSRVTLLKNALFPPGDVDSLEDQLEQLLKGEGIGVQGYISPLEEVGPLTVQKTVCYILAAVILNEQLCRLCE